MDRTAFYAALRPRTSGVFGTSLSQGQVRVLDLILDEGERRGLILTHLAYVLATPYHEVGSGMQPVVENLNYTKPETIRKTWPTRFATIASAQPYVRQPQKLANKVYGDRMGNTGPNDGWAIVGAASARSPARRCTPSSATCWASIWSSIPIGRWSHASPSRSCSKA